MDTVNAIWILILLLVVLALVGGLAINSWVFLLLIVAILLVFLT